MGVTLSSGKCLNKVNKVVITNRRERGNKRERRERKEEESRGREDGRKKGGEKKTLLFGSKTCFPTGVGTPLNLKYKPTFSAYRSSPSTSSDSSQGGLKPT